MRTIKFAVAALALMFAFGPAKTAQAEMATLLGPVYIVNQINDGKGAALKETGVVFHAPVPGKGVIIIRNGGDSGETARASSASVKINDVEIASERDFNKGVQLFTYDVDLQAQNELKALVRSCDKCEIEITVLGEAMPAPTDQQILLQQFGRLPQ